MLADPTRYGRGVPHAEFARLRRERPVSWVAEPVRSFRDRTGAPVTRQGTGFWAVTRHADVVAASRAPGRFSSAARGAFLADPADESDLHRTRQLLVNMDDPAHARIRRYATAAFTPRTVGELAEGVRAHAAALVARAVAADSLDLVRDLAAELPLLVLTDLLGMPQADRGLLFTWSNNLVGFDDAEYGGDVATFQRTFREAFAYARELAAGRRRRPGADLVSRLLEARVDGRPLAEDEFCQLWLLLVIAGNETTRHLISGGLLALAEHPGEARRLAGDPGGLPAAVDELLRWVSPIMQFRRTAVEDCTLGGQRIAAGDKVVLFYVSANRDEAVFADPDRLDLRRRPNPHLAFGVGPHYCLGSHLAHLEARVLLDELRPYLDRLVLAGPPVRLESTFVNGIKNLPAGFAPRGRPAEHAVAAGAGPPAAPPPGRTAP